MEDSKKEILISDIEDSTNDNSCDSDVMSQESNLKNDQMSDKKYQKRTNSFVSIYSQKQIYKIKKARNSITKRTMKSSSELAETSELNKVNENDKPNTQCEFCKVFF